VNALVQMGQLKQLKEIEIYGANGKFQIRTYHQWGISVINLTTQDAKVLRQELDEWLLSDQLITKNQNLTK
jgi:hypothetical protein